MMPLQVFVEPFEQLIDVVFRRTGQRPRRALDDPLVAVGEPFAVVIEGLVADQRGEDIHEYHGVRFVGHRECVDDLGDHLRPDFLDLADEPARSGAGGIFLGDQLLDQLFRAK